MTTLHIDFECYSTVDITETGLENYMRAPGFCVTVMAWAFDDEPVQVLQWPHVMLPQRVREHISNGGEVRAHNAGFEFAILKDHFGMRIFPSQMRCTMAKALAFGLPGGLLAAGQAMALPIIKDESKRYLMLRMGRPGPKGQMLYVTEPHLLAELAAYCMGDVEAERCLDRAIPDLHHFEQELFELDMKINRKGVLIDLQAVTALKVGAEEALEAISAECLKLTNGAVRHPGREVPKLKIWLASQGCTMLSLDKASIEAQLKRLRFGLSSIMCKDVIRVLELRQMAARSSVAKLESMKAVASYNDNRARHLLQFYGAGRTGRWAGRLIQPQNLPRSGDTKAETVIGLSTIPEALGLLYEDPMREISRSLRSCFIAKPGHELVSVDLSQIEARVLAWIAGQGDVVDAFRKGEDVYTLAAHKVGSNNRQLGKVLTLACGYGMGAQKFRDTAEAAPYYVKMTLAEATSHLSTWRKLNGAITGLWNTFEEVVRQSVMHPGVIMFLPRGMKVRTKHGVTQIRKPNGVKLTYHNMRLQDGGLVFDGVNSKTKKWNTERTYGGRLVENVVQSVARDIMATGMLSIADVPVMTVHDEIVWEVPEGAAVFPVFAPSWGSGLPLASEPHVGKRYAK